MSILTRCTLLMTLLSFVLCLASTAMAGSRTFYENGNLKSEMVAEPGQKPVLKSYQENGKLLSETVYNGSQPEAARWYDENGVLQSSEIFADAKTRVVTFYNPLGQKLTEETRVDGKAVKGRTFYPNGNVEKEYAFDQNGKLDGKFIMYYENGKVQGEYEYKNGEQL